MAKGRASLVANIIARDRASKVFRTVGVSMRQLSGIAGTLGAVVLARKLTQGFKFASTTAASFEKSMSRVKAITRASTEEMASLEAQALTMGRTTVFTAKEAADAQNNLALAGFKTAEILGALPGVLDAAAAGEMDMASAASLTADVLRTFQLETTKSADVANILAKSASTSNQTMNDLAESFKFVGAASASIGVSIDETVAALSLLADRGIRASLAGTALNTTFATFLGSIETDAKGLGDLRNELFDNEGRFIGLADAIGVMQKAGLDSGDMWNIFGKRAGKAMSTLIRLGPEALKAKTADLLDRAGFSAQVAADKLDNFDGSMTLARAATDNFAIAIGEQMNPVLRIGVDLFSEWITKQTEAAESSYGVFDASIEAFKTVIVLWRTLLVVWNALDRVFTTAAATLTSFVAQLHEFEAMGDRFKGSLLGGLSTLFTASSTENKVLQGLSLAYKNKAQAADDAAAGIMENTAGMLAGQQEQNQEIENTIANYELLMAAIDRKAEAERAALAARREVRKNAGTEGGGTPEAPEVLNVDDATFQVGDVDSDALAKRQSAMETLFEAMQTQAEAEIELALWKNAELLNNDALAFDQRLVLMQEQLALEKELVVDSLNAEMMERLSAAGTNGAALTAVHNAWRAKRLAIDKEFDNAELANERTVQEAKRDLYQSAAADIVNFAQGIFGEHKALAVAETVISTWAGAQKAYEAYAAVPPLAAAMAAMAVAAGMMRVQKIMSTSKGGGSGFLMGGIAPRMVTGPSSQFDSVTANLRPGEAVLPNELTNLLLEAAATRSQPNSDVLIIRADPGVMIDRMTRAQRNGRATMRAAQLLQPRRRR